MKINYVILITCSLLIMSCAKTKKSESVTTDNQPKNEVLKTFKNQKIKVYTTAKDTNLKLSLTNEIVFGATNQPTESEVSIDVNPNKTFQKF